MGLYLACRQEGLSWNTCTYVCTCTCFLHEVAYHACRQDTWQVLKIVPRNCKQDKTVAIIIMFQHNCRHSAATKDIAVYHSNSLAFCKMQWSNSIKCWSTLTLTNHNCMLVHGSSLICSWTLSTWMNPQSHCTLTQFEHSDLTVIYSNINRLNRHIKIFPKN